MQADIDTYVSLKKKEWAKSQDWWKETGLLTCCLPLKTDSLPVLDPRRLD
jgi:hypothetical protein